MIKLIAETAWHHEGAFDYMEELLDSICASDSVDVVKMHITLDFDEYMSKDHRLYETLRKWLFTEDQWSLLIERVRLSGKQVMLLLNDTHAITFASEFSPDYVELHSTCMNVPTLQNALLENFSVPVPIVIGVGGSSIAEVDAVVRKFSGRDIILMFGFQNYPTKYEDVSLGKIRKIQSIYPQIRFGYADHTAWNETNNELITLLVAANNMEFVEKHVTKHPGVPRCDHSSAVSIDLLQSLRQKLSLVEEITGNYSLDLNEAERQYSNYGPMKMAALALRDIAKGEPLNLKDFRFCRTSQETLLSQTDLQVNTGKHLVKKIKKGFVLNISHLK